MESMKLLDQKGIFEAGDAKDQVVIAVEIVPPVRANYTMTERLYWRSKRLTAQYKAMHTAANTYNEICASRLRLAQYSR